MTPSRARLSDGWARLIASDSPRRRRVLTAVTLALVALIALADFLLGFEISLLAFYFLPVSLAVLARGWRFGVLVAVISVAGWLAGDIAAGARYSSPVVPAWNAGIALLTFLVLIGLFAGLLHLQRDLEARVARRTEALATEVAERERLEREILEISERERRSIGHELHDGLGQHLTGTALVAQVLTETLQDRGAPEAGEARKLVGLVKSGIEQTRSMAKGLLLADLDADGLNHALREFCSRAGTPTGVVCRYIGEAGDVTVPDGVATHLLRIGQEAVRNALRHSRARRIEVRLGLEDRSLVLSIQDDGIGVPPAAQRGGGLGLRIMEHRARIVGAGFALETEPGRGTLVQCRLPLAQT